MLRPTSLAAAVLLLVAGCGDSGGPAGPTFLEHCNEFFVAQCARMETCGVLEEEDPATEEDEFTYWKCVNLFEAFCCLGPAFAGNETPCDQLASPATQAEVDACTTAVGAIECAAWADEDGDGESDGNTSPAQCEDVLAF